MNITPPAVGEMIGYFPSISDLEFIASGGFKAVYSGTVDGKKEALKLVHIPRPVGLTVMEAEEIVQENIKRISREITLLQNCASPNIVNLGSIQQQETIINGNVFVAYSEEYLDGKSLDTLIREKYVPPEIELRKLAVNLFSSVQELWTKFKVVHRDIKPLNIIKHQDIDRGFVLIDLGIAFAILETALTLNPATAPGSLYYLSPEMFKPNFRETLDYKSDLYNAGLAIYEYATGINPFNKLGDVTGQTMFRIQKERPRPLKEIRDDLSDEFCETIDQLLKKIPALRPSQIDKLILQMENLS